MKESEFPMAGASAGDDQDKGVDVVAVLRAFRKHWALVLAMTALVGLAVTFYTLGQKKIYQANAKVMFDPSPPRPLGSQVETVVDMGTGNFWSNQEYYNTQYELMKSKRVATAVVQDLSLHQDPGFLSNAPMGARLPPREVSLDAAAALLISRLSVAPVKNSRLARLSYEDANPERAQRIALAIVETFTAKNVEDMQASTTSAVEWLNSQLDKLKTGLDSSEMALHEFKLDKNILSADIDSQSNMLRAQMTAYSTALTEARIKRVELASRYGELRKISGEEPSLIPSSELLQSGVLTGLRSSYLDALRQREMLLAGGKGENHPEVKSADAQIRVSKAALLREIRNIQGAVAHDLEAVRAQEAGLAGLSEGAKKEALDLNLLSIEYNRLYRSKENSEKLYGIVLERSKEGDLTRMIQVNNIRVVERPELPGAAIRPNVMANIGAGVGAGFVLGLLLAIGMVMLDRSVKTKSDVEGHLGLTFLGLVPAVTPGGSKKSKYYGYGGRKQSVDDVPKGEMSPDLIVHQAPLSGPAEAARSIRTNIQFMSPDRPFHTLLVTSAGPSEGKTTIASAIAIAMAQVGLRVLLMDCDLRRPRVHRVYGKSSDTGLTVALLDRSMLTAELLATDIPNLSVLPAGPVPPNPAEILTSERFAELLRELKGQFDRIIIDSPPVVPVTDAAILATQVDGTILVVRAFKTSKDLVLEAKRTLVGVGARMVGTVLNAVDRTSGEYAHYQYQYYRKGGYYKDADGSTES